MVHEGDAWVLQRHAWAPTYCALLHQINGNVSALGMFLAASGRRLWDPGRGSDALRRCQHALGKCLGTPGRSLVFKRGAWAPQGDVGLFQGGERFLRGSAGFHPGDNCVLQGCSWVRHGDGCVPMSDATVPQRGALFLQESFGVKRGRYIALGQTIISLGTKTFPWRKQAPSWRTKEFLEVCKHFPMAHKHLSGDHQYLPMVHKHPSGATKHLTGTDKHLPKALKSTLCALQHLPGGAQTTLCSTQTSHGAFK